MGLSAQAWPIARRDLEPGMRQANCVKVSGRPAGMVRSAAQTLRWNGVPRISRSISRPVVGEDRALKMLHVSLYGALVADDHVVRKNLPELVFQFFGIRTQQDGAHPYSTAGNESLAEITSSYPELDGLDPVCRCM